MPDINYGRSIRIFNLYRTLGTWHILGHPAMSTPETQAIGHQGYEFVANERSGEVFAITSQKVMEVIKRRNIKLLSYNDLVKQSKPAAP